jgi:hypothetical protein
MCPVYSGIKYEEPTPLLPSSPIIIDDLAVSKPGAVTSRASTPMRLICEYEEIDDSESITSTTTDFERDESEALTDDSVSTHRGWTGYFDGEVAAPSTVCGPTGHFYSQISYKVSRQGEYNFKIRSKLTSK